MRYAALVLSCAALLACDGDEVLDTARGVSLSVDRRSYTAVPSQAAPTRFEFRVVATVRNDRREVIRPAVETNGHWLRDYCDPSNGIESDLR